MLTGMTDQSGASLDTLESDPTMAAAIATQFGEGGPPFMTALEPRITHAAVGRVRFEVNVTGAFPSDETGGLAAVAPRRGPARARRRTP